MLTQAIFNNNLINYKMNLLLKANYQKLFKQFINKTKS